MTKHSTNTPCGPHTASLAHARVLVTGAAGFLGRHLCRALTVRGAVVFGVSRRADVADCAETLVGDCADFEFARHMLATARPDVVFHMAGSADGSRDLDRVLPGLQDDLVSTVTLLTAATEAAVGRVVVTGSMEEPDLELGDLIPSSPYSAAKLCVGFYARMFHAVYRTPVTLVRPFVTYGPGQNETKLIPYVIRSLQAGRAPRLSSCNRGADLVYVDDMIEGIISAAAAPPCPDGVELGSGRLVVLRDVVERISQLIDCGIQPEFGALVNRKAEQVRAARIERATECLGWRATTSLDDGLRRTIEWCHDHPALETTEPCTVR